MLIINIIVFAFLAFYFDQVFPNEFGKKRHPLFCFMCLKKSKKDQLLKKVSSDQNIENDSENPL